MELRSAASGGSWWSKGCRQGRLTCGELSLGVSLLQEPPQVVVPRFTVEAGGGYGGVSGVGASSSRNRAGNVKPSSS